jgi:hypothetical protein
MLYTRFDTSAPWPRRLIQVDGSIAPPHFFIKENIRLILYVRRQKVRGMKKAPGFYLLIRAVETGRLFMTALF